MARKLSNCDYITGLYITYGQTTDPPLGYKKVNYDLSKGAGGEYVYICYSNSPGEPITDIKVLAGDKPDFATPLGYTKLNFDLNKGSGGKYIYVFYACNSKMSPITEISVIQGSSRDIYSSSEEWTRIDQDCSEGARGLYTYIIYKR